LSSLSKTTMARATVVYAAGSMPAGAAEGAAAGLSAVAGTAVAAVSPAARTVAPVTVTTERRVSGAQFVSGGPAAVMSGVARSEVFVSCVLIKIMLGVRPGRNQGIHTDGELKPLVPAQDGPTGQRPCANRTFTPNPGNTSVERRSSAGPWGGQVPAQEAPTVIARLWAGT
jgi:hypothetical protein